MTTRTDPRGADRRAPTAFGDEIGLDIPNDAGPSRRHWDHTPLRGPIPDHGCHGYELRGVMFTRCIEHQPAGSHDTGPVLGACIACAGRV